MAIELNQEDRDSETQDSIGRHLRLGWWLLLCFLTLGAALETMHGLKVGWLLDVSNETRRLLFRLAHAHGVLLSLVNIAFAFTLSILPSGRSGRWRLASTCLIAASILMPGGFLLGGIVIYGAGRPPDISLRLGRNARQAPAGQTFVSNALRSA